jgi:putative membrane protein
VSSASSPTRPTLPADEPGVEDATRRTRLANERTYLAWWRTGLSAFAVAVGVGRLVPEVANTTHWPYEVLGTGYGLLGLAFVICAYTRTRAIEDALDRGTFAEIPRLLFVALSGFGALLGVATIVVVLVVR